MLDSWSNERLMIHTVTLTSFGLTASQGSYTIGNGGNFNMPRPTRIINPCWIRDSGDIDYALELINTEAYGRIPDKTTDGTYPQYLYYDYGYSATSTGTVYFWPEPDSGLSTFINTLQPITTLSSMSHSVLMPPGYQDAIELNYAVRSALGVAPVSPELERAAMKSKAALKSQNSPAPISRIDYSIGNYGGRRNIFTGP